MSFRTRSDSKSFMYNAFFSYSTVADMIIPALRCLPRTVPVNRPGEGHAKGERRVEEKKIVAPRSRGSIAMMSRWEGMGAAG